MRKSFTKSWAKAAEQQKITVIAVQEMMPILQ
jgi:hypothetical protein